MGRRSWRAFKNVESKHSDDAIDDPKVPGCSTGKKIIKKKRYAVSAARRCTKKFGIPTRYYRCRDCRHFHTTTKGSGINPDTGLREDVAKRIDWKPATSLTGSTVRPMVKRAIA